MTDYIRSTRQDGLLEIVIDRPERRNAITGEMYGAMADAIRAAEDDGDIRVILLRGEGDVFTAGNDLDDFVSNPPDGLDQPVFAFMRSVLTSSKVVVAAVSGLAIGIGTTLLLHCDLVVAGRSTRFKAPFVDLGLVPEFGSSRLLPQAMGRRRAARHLLLSEEFDAPAAEIFGIVSQVVDDDQVLETAHKYVRTLLAKPPAALARTKKMLAPDADELAELIKYEAGFLVEGLKGPEFAEAADAFFNKRKPDFSKTK
ncbi:enoyl-CoA hydratase [Sphingobium chlorophenolicum]|uniref:Enoyl-CoA hydratase/isomerase n=1 Tax=Sphingobium chlorophenolicum TaxID=46429 RepID=A0A081RAS7_SPHCR|nr:enoyl-CoA hydratase [Sphingobium chlorophenolicum]KEQ52300.1 Enoyl-CoA hydratase/isomerase [Sphingobium chlorophenolicum]